MLLRHAPAAQSVKLFSDETPARWFCSAPLVTGLPQDLENMVAELRHLVQQEHAVVGQRHVTRHRHVAPADQPHIREGVVGRATRAGRD
jgi:hypothetical protein